MITVDEKYYHSMGIYFIFNNITNNIYVGSAVCLGQRIKNHRNSLRNNKHRNKYLQNAFNKYGEENFEIRPVEILYNKKMLIEREQHHIDIQKKIFKHEYNINPIAGSALGYHHTEETKKHLSEIKLNKNNPQYGKTGENNPNHKLTKENVIFIRNNANNYSFAELGRMFSVAYPTISGIVKRKNWINI